MESEGLADMFRNMTTTNFLLFSVTFGLPDHIHLKWLNKFVTSIDP